MFPPFWKRQDKDDHDRVLVESDRARRLVTSATADLKAVVDKLEKQLEGNG